MKNDPKNASHPKMTRADSMYSPTFNRSCFTMAVTSLSFVVNFNRKSPGFCSAVRAALNVLLLLTITIYLFLSSKANIA